jgi:predicted SAM-dependent methyltransferase
MRLNLGCGEQVVDGWLNVDYALGARVSKIPVIRELAQKTGIFHTTWDKRIFLTNLTKDFPWEDNSIETIYSSHTLEHFTRAQGQHFLRECFRVLQPGGTIRIVIPDLAHIVNSYQKKEILAENFLDELHVLYENGTQSKSNFKRKLAPFIHFPHKCMYDTEALIRTFKDVGFSAESRSAFESAIRDIKVIEKGNRTRHAVIVEGMKV